MNRIPWLMPMYDVMNFNGTIIRRLSNPSQCSVINDNLIIFKLALFFTWNPQDLRIPSVQRIAPQIQLWINLHPLHQHLEKVQGMPIQSNGHLKALLPKYLHISWYIVVLIDNKNDKERAIIIMSKKNVLFLPVFQFSILLIC